MLQNLPTMLSCNSFKMSLLCSYYAQFFKKITKQGRSHFSCTFYYSGLSGDSKLFIATVVTQFPPRIPNFMPNFMPA